MELSQDQLHALDVSKKWYDSEDKFRVPFVLTGPAGTGKSTIVQEILKTNGINPESTLILATSATAVDNIQRKNPTAKARTIASFIKGQSEVMMVFQKDESGEHLAETWSDIDDIWKSHLGGFNSTELYESISESSDDFSTVSLRDLQGTLSQAGYRVERVNSFDINQNKVNEMSSSQEERENNYAEHLEDYANHSHMAPENFEPWFREKLRKWREKDAKKTFASVLIIDELGMVNQAEMDALRSSHLPIIAAGDTNQLPPVENSYSKNPGEKQNREISQTDSPYYVALTNVHRQDDGSALLDVADAARLGNDWLSTAKRAVSNGAKDILYRPDLRMNREALKFADMILAMTNRNVQYFNQMLHAQHGIAPLYAGDKIVVSSNSRTKDAGLSRFINGQVGVINKVYDEKELADIGLALVDMTINGEFHERIIVNTYMMDNPRINAFIMKDASDQGMNYYRRRADKKMVQRLAMLHKSHVEEIIYITYGYCMTVYRAQGKEWDNVVLDPTMPNVMKKNERQLIYTAITRTKNMLLIL